MPKPDELGPLELEIMRILWRIETGTVREVLEIMHEEGQTPAYTTIQTVMTRLREKGFLRAKTEGKTYRYWPTVTENQVRNKSLNNLLNRFFDGAVGPLVNHLAESKRLTQNDLDALRKIVDEHNNKRAY